MSLPSATPILRKNAFRIGTEIYLEIDDPGDDEDLTGLQTLDTRFSVPVFKT